jgi:hypothetical protein
MEEEIETLGMQSDEWKKSLATWIEEFGEDFPVVFYEFDGNPDKPEEFFDYPHLAVRIDAETTIPGAETGLVWPVDVDGWTDIRPIGFVGILPLLTAGNRTED